MYNQYPPSRYKLILYILLVYFNHTVFAQTVTIGNQIWTTRNLNVDTFRNGDLIPMALTDEQWATAGKNQQPAWCYYDNDITNGLIYGKLYNWYAVNDPRGLAPVGYHIPSDAEWTILTDYLGGESLCGKKMKSTIGWGPYKDITNTNESGFTGLPGGWRYDFGSFLGIGGWGFWWSSSNKNIYRASSCSLWYNYDTVFKKVEVKNFGYSVRCIKN